jgi:NADP-dependent 3-hydroxy acid dehydrogenase YdfG
MTKTILITGASSGFGRETAQLFHQQGWNVIATMRSPEKENELNELTNILVTYLDVQDQQSITTAVNAGIEHFAGQTSNYNSVVLQKNTAWKARFIFSMNGQRPIN